MFSSRRSFDRARRGARGLRRTEAWERADERKRVLEMVELVRCGVLRAAMAGRCREKAAVMLEEKCGTYASILARYERPSTMSLIGFESLQTNLPMAKFDDRKRNAAGMMGIWDRQSGAIWIVYYNTRSDRGVSRQDGLSSTQLLRMQFTFT